MKTKLNLNECTLVVVDMVNGFVNEGPMADKKIRKIITPIDKLIKKCNHVLFFRDCHEIGDLEEDVFGRHCIIGTKESEIIREFQKYFKDVKYIKKYIRTICKNSTNGFHALNKEMLDSDFFKETIIITGCCTDICVLQFALSLITYYNSIGRKVEIIIPKNCVDTYHLVTDTINHDAKEFNNISLTLMQNAGIKVVDEIII